MREQRLYIRADMNDVIATGHMMRCLSIADAAAKKRDGESFDFIGRYGLFSYFGRDSAEDREKEIPQYCRHMWKLL